MLTHVLGSHVLHEIRPRLVKTNLFQARIAQLVAYRLGTGEVSGSNPGKGENFSVKKFSPFVPD